MAGGQQPHTSNSSASSGSPKRKVLLILIIVAVVVVAIVVTLILVFTRDGAGSGPTDRPSATSGSSSTDEGSGSSSVDEAALLPEPILGSSLRLSSSDDARVMMSDARWNSMAIAYVDEDETISTGLDSLAGVSLADQSVVWTWSVGDARDDSGNVLGHPCLRWPGSGSNPPLEDGSSDNPMANGKGQITMYIRDALNGYGVDDVVDTYLYVFNVDDGSVVYHHKLGGNGSSVLAFSDSTIVAHQEPDQQGSVPNSATVAMTTSGDVLWTSDDSGSDPNSCGSYSSSVIKGTWVPVPGSCGYVDIAAGKLAPFGQDLQTAIYYSVGDVVYRYDSSAGTVDKWDIVNNVSLWAAPVSVPGVRVSISTNSQANLVFIGGYTADRSGQTVGAYEVSTGAEKWKVNDDWYGQLVAGDFLISAASTTDNGSLQVINMADGSQKTTLSCDPSEQASTCVALAHGGIVLARSYQSDLVAYDTSNVAFTIPIWKLDAHDSDEVYVVANHLILTDGGTIKISQ